MDEETKYRRLKIISDGSKNCNATRVVDVETGELIPNVRCVSFKHDANELPVAYIELLFPEIEVTTEVERLAIVDGVAFLRTLPDENCK